MTTKLSAISVKYDHLLSRSLLFVIYSTLPPESVSCSCRKYVSLNYRLQ